MSSDTSYAPCDDCGTKVVVPDDYQLDSSPSTEGAQVPARAYCTDCHDGDQYPPLPSVYYRPESVLDRLTVEWRAYQADAIGHDEYLARKDAILRDIP